MCIIMKVTKKNAINEESSKKELSYTLRRRLNEIKEEV